MSKSCELMYQIVIGILSVVLLAYLFIYYGNVKENAMSLEDDFWKSVTFFGDAWPINFWNSEWDNLDDDFDQIRNDGFNSIVLVIPWREFQPSIDPISFNDRVFDRLEYIAEAAKRHSLGVIVRVSYTWDFYRDETDDINNRFYCLIGEDKCLNAWLEYINRVYLTLKPYDNFWGGFITWEDFWNVTYLPTRGLSRDSLVASASYLGYQSWLRDNYSLIEINNIYNENFTSYDVIPVPNNDSPAMTLWYSWYDEFLLNLLTLGQDKFPGLSMEVRTDWDVVKDKNGINDFYKHSKTYTCGSAEYTAVMYGIPQGNLNNGESLSSSQALEKTDYILKMVSDNTGGKKLFVEQFLFTDNTPMFNNNAKLLESDIGDYLDRVGPVLKKYARGYGIWTYKDYKANMIYNSQFALGLDGWRTSNVDAFVVKVKNNMKLFLPAGSSVVQGVASIRDHYPLDKYYLELDVNALSREGMLTIQVGDQFQEVLINKKNSHIALEFLSQDTYTVTITASEDSLIDNVYLYSFIQEGKLYHDDNDGFINNVRYLNAQLEEHD